MIFNFLKYLRPIWYFNLKPDTDYGYFPTAEQLEEEGITIEADHGFTSEEARERELAWRAFQQGFISKTERPGIDVWQAVEIPVVDEYRFLRKNFHKAWILYVLVFRLFSFKNPFREWAAYFKTSGVKRIDYANKPITYPDYDTFESPLLQSRPLVSVVIPTLNRYDYLKDVFKDLEAQTYTNFEVIVVDQTDPFREDFYKDWKLNLTYWYQEEKALWKARNEAIKAAKGDYIIMSEDDVRIDPDYIEKHIKVLNFFDADISCGVFFPAGTEIPKERDYFKYGEQFATGNAFLKKEIFRHIGLYDRQFEKQRMGDGEFGLRAYLKGFKSVSNPLAFCVDVKAPAGGLRSKGGSWDAWRPKKWTDPRPVPSVLYLSRKYYGNALARFWIVHSILPSVLPYRFKRNKFLKLVAVIFLPLIFPLIILQVWKSWKLATAKLKQGALIELL